MRGDQEPQVGDRYQIVKTNQEMTITRIFGSSFAYVLEGESKVDTISHFHTMVNHQQWKRLS